ncbi:hypothetical protein FRC17_002056 [Serendipita sp. 399]|nr:hypothetical protein FRC17_002056 [Serendipita sp. 399]
MQKVARTHFETTYPKLLDDHMECMEQVRKLVLFNATRRSELSTTIACNSSAEKECVDKFSTTDAIAVPHLKMGLEMCQREYHHAPVLNVLTRELDEGCTVILGREIVSGATENLAQDVIIACLKRCTRAVSVESRWKLRLENYWDIIHRMELNPSAQNISYLVATLDKVEAMELIRTIMSNTGARHPILNIVDLESMQKLQTDCWDRSALARVMKDVNPDVRTILNACATAYITTKEKHVANLILQTRFGEFTYSVITKNLAEVDLFDLVCAGDLSLIDLKWLSLDAIFSMWDCDEWKPLPKDVEWRRQYQCSPGSTPFMSRMRRFPAVAGYNDGWVYIDVDTDGAISDTQWNQSRRTWIKWVGEEGDGPVSKSRIGSILRKFNI